MTSISLLKVIQVSLVSLVFAAALIPGVAAQSAEPGRWSEVRNLTGWLDQPVGPRYPRLTADAAGTGHAIWEGWAGPAPESFAGSNAIFYSRYTGDVWSDPTDILAAGGEELLAGSDIEATPDGTVLVLWTTGGSVVLSRAPAAEAGDARAWRSQGIVSGTDGRLAQDAVSGRWHLTAVNGGNLQFWTSEDRGETWDSAGIVWEAAPESRIAVNGDLLVDQHGTLHAVWSEHDPTQGYAGVAIWHGWQPAGESAMRVREVARRVTEGAPTIASPTIATSDSGNHLHRVEQRGGHQHRALHAMFL